MFSAVVARLVMWPERPVITSNPGLPVRRHDQPPVAAFVLSLLDAVFHAFLADVLDQHYYSLCPSAPPPRSPRPFPPSVGLTRPARSRGQACRRGGFTGSLDHDALIDFPSAPVSEACLGVMGNKEKCQDDQNMILHFILLLLAK